MQVAVNCEWSRRAGKTKLCAYEGRRSVINRGGNFVMFAADAPSAQDNWREVEQTFDDIAVRKNMVSKGEIEVPNTDGQGKSSFVRLVMAGGKKITGRGAIGECVLFDEIQLLDGATFARMAPAISMSRGVWFGTMTPPSTPTQLQNAQWLRNDLDLVDWHENELCKWGHKGGDRSILYVHAPIKPWMLAHKFRVEDIQIYGSANVNPWDWYIDFAAKEIERLRIAMNNAEEMSFERECELRWDKAPAQHAYRDIVHQSFSMEAEYQPGEGDVFVSVDRGEGAAYTVVLWFQVREGRIFVFDEFFTRSVVPEGEILADVFRAARGEPTEIVKRSDEFERVIPYETPLWATGDVRAPRMLEAMKRHVYDVHAKNVSLWLGYKVTRGALEAGLLKIHPRCKLLREEMLVWTYDGETQAFGLRNNDAAQTMQYGVVAAARMLNWESVSRRSGPAQTPARVIGLPIIIGV